MLRKHTTKSYDISFLVDKCIGKGVSLYMKVCKHWEEIVGEKVFCNSCPSFISRNKLYVNVTSAPWKSELGYLKDTILTKINERIRPYFIRDIHFRIGEIHINTSPDERIRLPKKINKKNLSVIESASQDILDTNLKDIFKNAMLRSFSRKETR